MRDCLERLEALWEQPAAWLQDRLNLLDFTLRQNHSRQNLHAYQEPAEDNAEFKTGAVYLKELAWRKTPFRLTEEQVSKADALVQRYQLEAFSKRCTHLRYLENLTVLDYLEQFQAAYPFCSSNTSNWLDVGSKNWSYVDALWAFLQQSQPCQLTLDGVEIDPYRRYTDGFTRGDYANAYINALDAPEGSIAYHAGNIQTWPPSRQKQYDVISCFLPFVFESPHRAWGLPKKHFAPQSILNRMLDLLKPNGFLLLVNQGQDEAEEQRRLLETARHHFKALGVELDIHTVGAFPASFLPYQYVRYGVLCQKKAESAEFDIA